MNRSKKSTKNRAPKQVAVQHKKRYAKLNRWVVPAVLGFCLSALAFAPTFVAYDTVNDQSNTAYYSFLVTDDTDIYITPLQW